MLEPFKLFIPMATVVSKPELVAWSDPRTRTSGTSSVGPTAPRAVGVCPCA